MSMKLKEITGVILAGGKSSRFGGNKALAELDGIPLIERVLNVMRPLFESVVIITNSPDEYSYLNIPTHRDLIVEIGPLGGIYTGLSKINTGSGFFIACDMPFLNHKLIRFMSEAIKGFDVVVPRAGWKIEALHAVYTKACLPVVKDLIDSGKYQARKIFDNVHVRYINEQEIKKFDPLMRSFGNINSVHELLEVKRGKGS